MKPENTSTATNIILNKETIKRKLRRMALEIAERNTEEKELLIAGIAGNGVIVAKELISILNTVTSLSINFLEIKLNKKDPLQSRLESVNSFGGKTIIIVDDVANTGKTIMYALKLFLSDYPKKIQTLVLVERSHKAFPVQTDYVGLSVATTLQEHISVETENGELMQAQFTLKIKPPDFYLSRS
jgi:pyrimidine operon attenuation protein / uracil phosphoribosyltransferase